MAPRTPPRFVVRRDDDVSRRRRRLALGVAWLASVTLAALLAWWFAPRVGSAPRTDRAARQALEATNADLKQQVANLERAAQVNDVALNSLRASLAQREEELNGLRSDLGFYSRLVGGSAQRQGLKLQKLRLAPIAGSPGWNLNLSLTQNTKRGEDVHGTAEISVEGLAGDKVSRLAWADLGHATDSTGLPFRFSYFQRLHGTVVLPDGFQPTRLHIRLRPDGGTVVDESIAWDAALETHPTPREENPEDVQPQTE